MLKLHEEVDPSELDDKKLEMLSAKTSFSISKLRGPIILRNSEHILGITIEVTIDPCILTMTCEPTTYVKLSLNYSILIN